MKFVVKVLNFVVIVICMKNEGLFIFEWLVYYWVIGVENFFVYINDCIDGIDIFFDLL